MKDGGVLLLALVAGLLLASYDLRTDDTGVEVGLLLVASLVLAAVAPRRWWLVALCVGLPIPLAELAVLRGPGVPGGVVAVGVALVGALIGYAIARASRTRAPA